MTGKRSPRRPAGPTVAVFIEDRSKANKDAVARLLKKIAPEARFAKPHFVGQGKMLDPDTLLRHAQVVINLHPGIRKLIILRDCECTDGDDLASLRQEAARVEASLQERLGRVAVRFRLAVHALEAWLMADEASVRSVLGRDVRVPSQPERLCRPKRELRRRSEHYEASRHNPRLAEGADPDVIGRSCPSFEEFVSAVTAR